MVLFFEEVLVVLEHLVIEVDAVVAEDIVLVVGIDEIVDELALLDAGLDVNLQDNDGDTPLIIAAKHEHKMLEQQFLNAGANPKITNKAGESADSIWAAQNAEEK